jgi:lysozyme family protein
MTASNFSPSLAITLKQEGGFSNDKADHGGRTMRGITWREYAAYRKRRNLPDQDVKLISDNELHYIYRDSYWLTICADALPAGLDLCAFDYAVNSGPSRAARALQQALGLPQTGKITQTEISAVLAAPSLDKLIDAYCDLRAAFLRRIGVGSQSVFLKGWLSRVRTIRREAHAMAATASAGAPAPAIAPLSMGSTGEDVTRLQTKLRALGYPVGLSDGQYGPATRRAVVLFMDEHKLEGEAGVWQADFWDDLEIARPIIEDRAGATVNELKASGDKQVGRFGFIRGVLSFLGLGFLAGGPGAESLKSFPEAMTAVQAAVEPVQGVLGWAGGNLWLLGLLAVVAGIVIVEVAMRSHVRAFRDGSYQGAAE